MDALANGIRPPGTGHPSAGLHDPSGMIAQQGVMAPPSWLITTALCVVLSALIFTLLKLTSKCLLPLAAILLMGSILAVLTLVTMGVTQVYTIIGTNATSPVEVFRATCSTMPLVGGELILVITSVCAFSIGVGCMLCILAGVWRGQHMWAESSGGLSGIGAMVTFCIVGVPFAMIGIAIASALVVIRCAPPPDNSTSSDNQTWMPIPDSVRFPPLRHAPWSRSPFTSWDHEVNEDALPQRVRPAIRYQPPSFRRIQQLPGPPQAPPSPPRRWRLTTPTEPPPPPTFKTFHHLMYHDKVANEQHGQLAVQSPAPVQRQKQNTSHISKSSDLGKFHLHPGRRPFQAQPHRQSSPREYSLEMS